jgi:hypothetical protein
MSHQPHAEGRSNVPAPCVQILHPLNPRADLPHVSVCAFARRDLKTIPKQPSITVKTQRSLLFLFTKSRVPVDGFQSKKAELPMGHAVKSALNPFSSAERRRDYLHHCQRVRLPLLLGLDFQSATFCHEGIDLPPCSRCSFDESSDPSSCSTAHHSDRKAAAPVNEHQSLCDKPERCLAA